VIRGSPFCSTLRRIASIAAWGIGPDVPVFMCTVP